MQPPSLTERLVSLGFRGLLLPLGIQLLKTHARGPFSQKPPPSWPWTLGSVPGADPPAGPSTSSTWHSWP